MSLLRLNVIRSNGPEERDRASNIADHSDFDILERLQPLTQRWRRLRPRCSSLLLVVEFDMGLYLASGASVQRFGQSLMLREQSCGSCAMIESMHVKDASRQERVENNSR